MNLCDLIALSEYSFMTKVPYLTTFEHVLKGLRLRLLSNAFFHFLEAWLATCVCVSQISWVLHFDFLVHCVLSQRWSDSHKNNKELMIFWSEVWVKVPFVIVRALLQPSIFPGLLCSLLRKWFFWPFQCKWPAAYSRWPSTRSQSSLFS